jgi:hypothetical protein
MSNQSSDPNNPQVLTEKKKAALEIDALMGELNVSFKTILQINLLPFSDLQGRSLDSEAQATWNSRQANGNRHEHLSNQNGGYVCLPLRCLRFWQVEARKGRRSDQAQ